MSVEANITFNAFWFSKNVCKPYWTVFYHFIQKVLTELIIQDIHQQQWHEEIIDIGGIWSDIDNLFTKLS